MDNLPPNQEPDPLMGLSPEWYLKSLPGWEDVLDELNFRAVTPKNWVCEPKESFIFEVADLGDGRLTISLVGNDRLIDCFDAHVVFAAPLIRKLYAEMQRPVSDYTIRRRVKKITSGFKRGFPVTTQEALPDHLRRKPLPDNPTQADVKRMIMTGEIRQQCFALGARVRVIDREGSQFNGLEGTITYASHDAAWVKLDDDGEEIHLPEYHLLWLDRPVRKTKRLERKKAGAQKVVDEALYADAVNPEDFVRDTFDLGSVLTKIGYVKTADQIIDHWGKTQEFDRGRLALSVWANKQQIDSDVRIDVKYQVGHYTESLYFIKSQLLEALDVLRDVEQVVAQAATLDVLANNLSALPYETATRMSSRMAVHIFGEAEEPIDPQRYMDDLGSADYSLNKIAKIIHDLEGWVYPVAGVPEGAVGSCFFRGGIIKDEHAGRDGVEYNYDIGLIVYGPASGLYHGCAMTYSAFSVEDEKYSAGAPEPYQSQVKALALQRYNEIQAALPGFVLGFYWNDNPKSVTESGEDLSRFTNDMEGPESALLRLGFVEEDDDYWVYSEPPSARINVLRHDDNTYSITAYSSELRIPMGVDVRVNSLLNEWDGILPFDLVKMLCIINPAFKLQESAELTAKEITQAAKEADPDPTDAQKEAENYKHGKIRLYGLDVSIENAKGSERSGKDANGRQWSVTMPAHYGAIRGVEGRDGDLIDLYIGDSPESDKVWVVDQLDAETGKFDEHKCMAAFSSEEKARETYLAGFSDDKGEDRLGAMTEMSVDEFKEWLKSGDTKKPLGESDFDPLRYAQDTFDLAARLAPLGFIKAEAVDYWHKIIIRPGKRDTLISIWPYSNFGDIPLTPLVTFIIEVGRDDGAGDWINISRSYGIKWSELEPRIKDTERLILKGSWSTLDVAGGGDVDEVHESEEPPINPQRYVDALIDDKCIPSFGYVWSKAGNRGFCYVKEVKLPQPIRGCVTHSVWTGIWVCPTIASSANYGLTLLGGHYQYCGQIFCKPAMLRRISHFESRNLDFNVSTHRMLVRIESVLNNIPPFDQVGQLRDWLVQKMDGVAHDVNAMAEQPLLSGDGADVVEALADKSFVDGYAAGGAIREQEVPPVDPQYYIDALPARNTWTYQAAWDAPDEEYVATFWYNGEQWGRSKACADLRVAKRTGRRWVKRLNAANEVLQFDTTTWGRPGMWMWLAHAEVKLNDKLAESEELPAPDVDPKAYVDSTFDAVKFLEASGFQRDVAFNGQVDRWNKYYPTPQPYALGGMVCTNLSVRLEVNTGNPRHAGAGVYVYMEDDQHRGLPVHAWALHGQLMSPAPDPDDFSYADIDVVAAIRQFVLDLPSAIESIQWPREDKALMASAAVKHVFAGFIRDCNKKAVVPMRLESAAA